MIDIYGKYEVLKNAYLLQEKKMNNATRIGKAFKRYLVKKAPHGLVEIFMSKHVYSDKTEEQRNVRI